MTSQEHLGGTRDRLRGSAGGWMVPELAAPVGRAAPATPIRS